jgi:phosphopantothenoylcysteine decarboxylase/phosphopantothenate--cysteine ligase
MRVLLGVSGGIAAYKAADVVSRLRQAGAEVRVVLTAAAARLVAPATFEALSGRPVFTDLFAPAAEGWAIPHVALAEWADRAAVAPATADTLAKLALGLADDFLSTALLAFPGPVVLAPAMNRFMWSHPAVQENVRRLGERGCRVVGPGFGHLAEEAGGWGRMADPGRIVAEVLAAGGPPRAELPTPPLAGVGVLVTAGPTWEAVDPIRGLTNRSSGRMGWALAAAARDRGARVTLVSGPVDEPDPGGVRVVRVLSALEMERAVRSAAAECRVVVAAAAVADWRPADVSPVKLKKAGAGEEWTLRLVRNPDILAGLGREKDGRLLVGFAAESEGGLAEARRKLAEKNLDLVVYNDVSAFGAEQSRIVVLDAGGGEEAFGPAPKRVLAERILDRVEARLSPGGSADRRP